MASVAAAPGVDSGGIPAALDPARVAEMLGCTESTVEELLRRGDLPGVKFGRGWCIPGAALIERLNDLATEQAAERRQSLAQPLSRPSARARQDQATGAEAAARAPRSRRRREPPSLTDESAP